MRLEHISLSFLLYFINFSLNFVNGSKILVILASGTKSHRNAFDPLFESLASKGHKLTIYTQFISKKPHENISEITSADIIEYIKSEFRNPFEAKLDGDSLEIFSVTHLAEKVCIVNYESEEMKGLKNEKFELILANAFVSECYYGLVEHFNAPLVLISSLSVLPWTSLSFGNPVSSSFNPHYNIGYSEKMNFIQRMFNLYRTVEYNFIRNYLFGPRMESIYRKYLPGVKKSFLEIESDAKIILINSHPAINPPRQLLPNMIEVAGMHCREAKKLPKDLEDFINSSGEDGVIFFSMGSMLQGASLPLYIQKILVESFAKLKQKVIWKFESDDLENRPPNVLIRKWLPQQDILAHPKTRLFITHGGLLSIQESIFHGVPIIGIPIFADQDGNMATAQLKGYGLKQDLINIHEIYEKIKIVLQNKSFSERAKEVSKQFKDRPISPIKSATFWIEYVLRNKDGVDKILSAGRELNFIQYYSIDVFLFLIFITILVLVLIYAIIKLLIRLIKYLFFSQTKSKSKQARKKKNN